MKKAILFLFFLISTLLIAQAPKRISYQAVARDASGNVMDNQAIMVKLTIHAGSSTGPVEYQETHAVTTNDYGLMNLKIGNGSATMNVFDSVHWENGSQWLEVAMDQSGLGTSYQNMGISELLSVPYALFAENAAASTFPGPSGPTGPTGQTGVSGATGPTGPAAPGGSAWEITGNSGTNDGLNFIGTTDNKPLNFRIFNQKAGRIDNIQGNTFFGYLSGDSVSTGSNNTAVGYLALSYNTTSGSNTAFGYRCLVGNKAAQNTGVGANALYLNLTGSQNAAFGYNALFTNNSGNKNTALGSQALNGNISGNQNTSVGFKSLFANSSGSGNVAIGSEAMVTTNSGSGNVSVGDSTMMTNTTGSFNTAVGTKALSSLTTGMYNTSIGYNSGGASAFSNTTSIGNGSTVSTSNMVRVGNASVTSIGGQVGWTTISDARVKTNLSDKTLGLEFILKLKPRAYFYSVPGQENILYHGFIAQEVEAASKESGISFSGVDAPEAGEDGLYGLRYAEFVVPLTRAVQDLHAQLEALKEENRLLKESIAKPEPKD